MAYPGVADEVLTALDRFNDAIYNKNIEAVVDLFADQAEVLWVGSEPGEFHRGKEAIREFFEIVFRRDVLLSWRYENIVSSVMDDVAWLFMEGSIRETRDGEVITDKPYRISGVLRRVGMHWFWLMYHGSEPAKEEDPHTK
jgi:uncharacterized protein (TIGR02246 family)